jgi:hypothetical protein
MVTEAADLAARGLALGLGAAVVVSPALAAPRVAAAVGVTATGVTAVRLVVSEQAGSTSTAADPAIAQNALTVYRMRINLVHLPGNTAERDERAAWDHATQPERPHSRC